MKDVRQASVGARLKKEAGSGACMSGMVGPSWRCRCVRGLRLLEWFGPMDDAARGAPTLLADLAPAVDGLTHVPSVEGLTLERLVIERGLAPPETLTRARLVQSESGEPLDAVLTRLGLVSEQALASAIAEAAGMRIASIADFPAEPVAADRLSPNFLRDIRALPIRLTEGTVEVAFVDPLRPFDRQPRAIRWPCCASRNPSDPVRLNQTAPRPGANPSPRARPHPEYP